MIRFGGNRELRSMLDRAESGCSTLAEQVASLETIRRAIPHTIFPLAADHPMRPDVPESDYACYAFALELTQAPCDGAADSAGFAFVEWLLRRRLLRPAAPGPVPDRAIALYRQQGQIRHAGITHLGRVLSKWGVGSLCEHALAEVPESYGDECEFFQWPAGTLLQDAWKAYRSQAA
jgi:hypothetical protein